jgi:diguanylate cyclase (GGDEF)-like protein
MDNLKNINDQFGHKEGDDAIREFSNCLLKTYRESDVVARLGGDEFGVLFAGVQPDNTEQMIERLSRRIKETNFINNRDIALEFSYGVAIFDPRRDSNLDVLVSDADLEMYARKRKKKRPLVR